MLSYNVTKQDFSSVVYALDLHLKVDFGTENQRHVKHPLKNLTWSFLTKLCSSCFYFYKHNSS